MCDFPARQLGNPAFRNANISVHGNLKALPKDISVNPEIMTAIMNLSTRVSVYFGYLLTHVVQVSFLLPRWDLDKKFLKQISVSEPTAGS